MDENLLGYLLGALDGPEHEEIRKQLDAEPQLRARLAEWEARLAPLERERWQYEPPEGLATATCEMVARRASQVTLGSGRISPSRSAMSEWNPRKHGWELVDMVVAAGIFLAAAMLFFPAIANSRQQARQLACANKLRAAAFAFSAYSDRSSGVLPYIPTQGKTGVAGYYGPLLMESGNLASHASVLCPSSSLAATSRNEFSIPVTDQIRAASGEALEYLQQTMGGSYAYSMGYRDRGAYRATRNRGRTHFPILSDGIQLPVSDTSGITYGHGDDGINVVYEGGNLRFIPHVSRQHAYFANELGLVAAGVNVNDAVLGHSWERPCPDQSKTEPSSKSGGDLESPFWEGTDSTLQPSAPTLRVTF